MKSNLFWLNIKDFVKGGILAILTGLLTALTPTTDLKTVLIAVVASFVAYLIKNYFTDHNDNIRLK